MDPVLRPAWLPCLAAALTIATPTWAWAQQSFFNVQAVEIAPPGRLFAQAQHNFGRDRGELNLTVDLGIASFFEAGCNVFHIPYYDLAPAMSGVPVDSAALLNASFLGKPTSWLRLTIGAQAGVGWQGTRAGATPVVEAWALARVDLLQERLRVVGGVYAGTVSAIGAGWPAGPQLGVEVVAIRSRLHVMADWLIGVNSASVAVVGLVALLPAGTQVSAGLQIPSPNSGTAFGGVLELTYVPEGESPQEEATEETSENHSQTAASTAAPSPANHPAPSAPPR